MTVMPEQKVLTQMGEGGMPQAVEAVADLLVSLNYHDVARELRQRWDDAWNFGDED